MREEIEQLFISVSDPNLAEIIAIIRGAKQDPPKQRKKHITRHMIVVENGLGYCSHRNSRNAPITYGKANELIADYEPDDRGISYLLYLCIKT